MRFTRPPLLYSILSRSDARSVALVKGKSTPSSQSLYALPAFYHMMQSTVSQILCLSDGSPAPGYMITFRFSRPEARVD